MRNRKLIMTLATPLLVAAPLAIVISCGEEQKQPQAAQQTAQQQVTTPKVDAPKDASNTGVTAPVENKPATQEQPKQADIPAAHSATSDARVVISQPVVKTYTQADIDPQMYAKIAPQLWANAKFNVYTVTLPGTSHTFEFAFDQASHYTDADSKKYIETWAANANYGYAILTLQKIMLTPMEMGSAGWGGSGKDVLVATKDLSTITDAHQRAKELQVAFNTLQHEYGHHETLSLIDGSGDKQIAGLKTAGVIGTTMFNAHAANAQAEQTRLSNLMTGKTLETYYEKFFGKQTGAVYSFDANFYFDLNYHFGTHPEFLNRVMNNMELSVLDQSAVDAFYAYPDLLKYQIGETNKLINDDKTYSKAAQDLVAAYGKYVYGYDGFGLQANSWELKGFSSTDFDFIKATDAASHVFTSHVDKITSHYVTKDSLFGASRVINNSIAVHANIAPQGAAAYALTSIEFYQDTNHNGQLDAADKKVEVTYKNQ